MKLKIAVEYDCGCAVLTNNGHGATLERCKMHDHSRLMLEALKACKAWTLFNCLDFEDAKCALRNVDIIINQAISKAEGKSE
jgi:hypothetical protein